MTAPNNLKTLLSFEDVAAALGCDDETVRSLVVEARVLPATRVTLVGHKEPYGEHSLDLIGPSGLVFDFGPSNRHIGFLRIERAALLAFAADRQIRLPEVSGEKPAVAKESSYLNIIAALLELVLSPRPGRESQARVIAELVENYDDRPGISKATLEKVFAAAKRSFIA